MSSFVPRLSRFIAPSDAEAGTPSAFELECKELEGACEFKSLSAKLREALKHRFSSSPVSDLQSAYAVLFELLTQWRLLASEAEGLADELTSSVKEEPALRCTLLLLLYSLVQQSGVDELRFSLLLRLVNYCAAIGELGKIFGPAEQRVQRVERWVRDWELPDAQQKELWGLVFDIHTDDARVMYACALKYFFLHESADLAALPALRDRIVKAVLITIRSPELVSSRHEHVPDFCLCAHCLIPCVVRLLLLVPVRLPCPVPVRRSLPPERGKAARQ